MKKEEEIDYKKLDSVQNTSDSNNTQEKKFNHIKVKKTDPVPVLLNNKFKWPRLKTIKVEQNTQPDSISQRLKRILLLPMLLLVIADLGYSFYQYLQKPLDGDLPQIVLPAPRLAPVLSDPFGIKVLTTQAGHAASNRYFAHQTLRVYFQAVPKLFRQFFHPVQSLYLSNATFLLLTHLFLLLMIGAYIASYFPGQKFYFVLALLLVSPLFQTNGYQTYMGLISGDASYTSAYAFPIALLLLFYLPFYRQLKNPQYGISFYKKLALIPLMIVLGFNGPLIAPLAIIISSMILAFYRFWVLPQRKRDHAFGPLYKNQIRNFQTATQLLSAFIVLCLYSFYIGTFNTESAVTISILERYQALFTHLLPYFFQKLGLPLLLTGILINTFLLHKLKPNKELTQILKQGKWILLFAIIYLLLLPLGGYRSYRPGIIRVDTFIPITIALIYYFGLGGIYLLKQLVKPSHKQIYIAGLSCFLAVYLIADESKAGENLCEQKALYTLSTATQQPVELSAECKIMNWDIVSQPEYSEVNAAMFQYWGITQEQLLYFQKK